MFFNNEQARVVIPNSYSLYYDRFNINTSSPQQSVLKINFNPILNDNIIHYHCKIMGCIKSTGNRMNLFIIYTNKSRLECDMYESYIRFTEYDNYNDKWRIFDNGNDDIKESFSYTPNKFYDLDLIFKNNYLYIYLDKQYIISTSILDQSISRIYFATEWHRNSYISINEIFIIINDERLYTCNNNKYYLQDELYNKYLYLYNSDNNLYKT